MKDLLICFTVFLTSCGTSINSKHTSILIDRNIEQKECSSDSIFEKIEHIFLDTVEDALISQVKAVKIVNEILYIHDRRSSTLFKFNLKGRFLGKAGTEGNSIGEYLDIVDFTVSQDNMISILDNKRSKIIVYNMDNQFLREFPVRHYPLAIQILPNGNYITYNPPQSASLNKNYLFAEYDPYGEMVRRMNKNEFPRGDEHTPVNYYSFHKYHDNISFISLDIGGIFYYNGMGFSPQLTIRLKKNSNTDGINRITKVVDTESIVFIDVISENSLHNYLFVKNENSIIEAKCISIPTIHLWGITDAENSLLPVWPEFSAGDGKFCQVIPGSKLYRYSMDNEDSIPQELFIKIKDYTRNPLCNPIIAVMTII